MKCLVVRWDGSSDRLLALDVLNLWARQSWGLKGDLKLSFLGDNLIIF